MSRRTTRLAAAIEQRRAEVYPLDKLPAEHQARIADAVAQDSPPPRGVDVAPKPVKTTWADREDSTWIDKL